MRLYVRYEGLLRVKPGTPQDGYIPLPGGKTPRRKAGDDSTDNVVAQRQLIPAAPPASAVAREKQSPVL